MSSRRSKLIGLVALLGLGTLGGCYGGYGPYYGGYRHPRHGYGRSYYGPNDGRHYYGPGYGRYTVPPPAPGCRRVWVGPRVDFWGRRHGGYWRCV